MPGKVVALCLSLALIASAAVALACGDKLLVVGQGARFQQAYRAAHPASILIYTRPNSVVPLAISDPHLQPALKEAGHKIQTVEGFARLGEALKTGNYDLVLADIADAAVLEPLAQAAPSRPFLLPVIYKGSKEEHSAAVKKYRCVFKAPNKTDHYLAAIDEAMKLRLKGGSVSSGR